MTWEWNTEIDLIGGLLAVALLYRMAIRMGRERYAPDEPFPVRSVLLMDTTLILFYLAVGSPLDEAGDRFLFCAHMLQHTILVFFLPPMFIAAIPAYCFRPLTENRATAAIFRFLVNPVVAILSFNIFFNIWHMPQFYEFALRDRQVHNGEHLMFMLSALQLWWPVVSHTPEFPRLVPGARMLYLFLASVAQIPLFGFLVMTGDTYYPTYVHAPRLLPITAFEDQAIGGIFMKLLGEIVFGTYLFLAFIEWYRSDNRTVKGISVAPSRA